MTVFPRANPSYRKTTARGARAVALALLLLCVTLLDWGGDRGAGARPALQATPNAVNSLIVEGDPIVRLIPSGPDASSVYAIGRAGLYRSDDGGGTWQLAGPLPPTEVVVAAVDDPDLLLAGGGLGCLRAAGENIPLYRSENGGASWEMVPGVVDVWPVAIWGNAKLALGATCAGFQMSTDSGLTWQESPSTNVGYDFSSFAVVATTDPAQQVLLVATTSEGGTTSVSRIDFSDPARPTTQVLLVNLFGFVPLAGRDDLRLAGTVNGVIVGTNDGDSRQSRTGLEEVTVSTDPLIDGIPDAERGRGVTAVAIDPFQPDHFYAGTGDGLFASSDAGMTWHHVPGVEGSIARIVIADAGDRLLVQTNSGVVMTDTE